VKTLHSLEILPDLLTAGTTISQYAGFEKPDRRIFEVACQAAGVQLRTGEVGNTGEGSGVLMVGDELDA
jgi:FMN phosphatase YigB (HAD superfamily)